MTVYDGIASELPALQAEAEALMTDTCILRRIDPTATPTQNEDTGTIEPAFTDLFTSRCKVQARSLQALTAEAGGRTATTVRLELHLPISSGALRTGDVAEVTAVGALSDAQLVGQKFRITAPVAKSFATARRYEVESVVS